ncbi:response regulator transcription factor [Streptomyces montanus]|uniref:Response regulator transcription factor n=1 Tax=Streptomyces montanus TaxID=2580423 RepID=A0A5R9FY86_9ACTN|nr:response regulator transcription factor [Streptomyces montanus]TLS46956.1 response regulator transcription factor [Streptomyces montanus]
MTTVLVVNDQPLQRRGLRMLLAAQPDLTVVGEAATGAEAVRMSAELLPDVVLMDGRIPDEDGTEIIRRVTRSDALARVPDPDPARSGHAARVLILTTTSHDEYACTALRAGAGGFLPQDATPGELTAAIHTVAAGDAVLTPGLTRRLIDVVRARPARPPTPQHRLDALTERERDVLTGVASGWSNTEIAERLSIAPTTVKSHITRILTKIGARARVQAVVFAYESGLVRRHDSDPPPSRAATIAAVRKQTPTTPPTRTKTVTRLRASEPFSVEFSMLT